MARPRGKWQPDQSRVWVRGYNNRRVLADEERKLSEWRGINGIPEWVAACKGRSGYRCERCGCGGVGSAITIHVHHKASFASYPTLRADVLNGISLCEECHWWAHSNAGRAQREAWEAEALVALAHLLPAQPTLALEAAE